MPNQLSTVANAKRLAMLAANRINANNPYSRTHPDALSDGDSYGRGEYNTVVGTREDLAARRAQVAFNQYGPNNVYVPIP